MYPKNAASPEPIAIGAVVQISDGAVQTSGCTVRIKPIGVAEGDGAGTTAYSTDGIVLYTPTQGETNYTSFILIAKKTGCIPVSVTVVTSASSTPGTVEHAGTIKTLDALDTAQDTQHGTTQTAIADVPTVSEFNARTLAAADYFDPAADAVANVTLVATTTNLTNLPTIPTNWLTAAGLATDAVEEIRNAITGGAYDLDTDANGRIRVVDGTGTGEISLTSGLLDWNSSWDTEVQSEVNDALVALNLDHWLAVATGSADMTVEVVDNSIVSRILSNGDTSVFDPSTDGLQPIRDRGDAAWLTPTGFSTHSASDVWAVATRVLTAATNITGAIADQVWEETIADHSGTAGSTAAALNSAGSAGDPWSTALPGAYGAGSAGFIIGTNLDAILSARTLASASYATASALATVDTVVDGIQTDLSNATDGLGALKTLIDALPSQADITGGGYALNTSATGSIRVVDGTGTDEISLTSGLIAGIAGTITTLDALDTAQDTQHDTTQTAIADVPTVSEITGISGPVVKLFKVLMRFDAATATDMADVLTIINEDAGSGDGSYDNQANSMQVIQVMYNGLQYSIGTVDGVVDALKLDTDDIQTRLPAALTAGGNMKADTLALSGDTVAADNAEAFFDGTGYSGTNNIIPTVTTLTNLPAITTNWLTATGLATDAVNEIRNAITNGSYALDTDANGRIRIVDGTATGELDTLSGTVLLRSATQASIDAIEADAAELQSDWVNGGRLDLLLDAIKAKTDQMTYSVANKLDSNPTPTSAICNRIADHVRRRTQANVEASSDGDTLSLSSLYGFIQQAQESSISGTTLTVNKTDGTTALGTKTLTSNASAEPVTGIA